MLESEDLLRDRTGIQKQIPAFQMRVVPRGNPVPEYRKMFRDFLLYGREKKTPFCVLEGKGDADRIRNVKNHIKEKR